MQILLALWEFLKIIALAIAAAVLYGIVHDQVTARVCVEYFTIGHEPIFHTDSPTLLAFGWGTIATWWVGLILGVPAAWLARVGRRPKLSAGQLMGPIARLLAVMACLALIAGVAGYLMARDGVLVLFEPMASRIPPEKHAAFLADAAAHLCSYAVGFLGGIVLCVWIWLRRRQLRIGLTRPPPACLAGERD